MSTRARVGMVRPNQTILSIYTQNDGYISHHGPLLLENYNTPKAVLALLRQGDCSVLNETVDDCVFYARDRGELKCEARTNNTASLFYHRANECNAEYIYLFNDGVWYVSDVTRASRAPNWQDLCKATITERLTA